MRNDIGTYMGVASTYLAANATKVIVIIVFILALLSSYDFKLN